MENYIIDELAFYTLQWLNVSHLCAPRSFTLIYFHTHTAWSCLESPCDQAHHRKHIFLPPVSALTCTCLVYCTSSENINNSLNYTLGCWCVSPYLVFSGYWLFVPVLWCLFQSDINLALCTSFWQSSVPETWDDSVWAGDVLPGPHFQESAAWGAGYRGTWLRTPFTRLKCELSQLLFKHHNTLDSAFVCCADCADILLERHDQQAFWPGGTWAERGQAEAAGGADSRVRRDSPGKNGRVQVSQQFCCFLCGLVSPYRKFDVIHLHIIIILYCCYYYYYCVCVLL